MRRSLWLAIIILISNSKLTAQCNPAFTATLNQATVQLLAAVTSPAYGHTWVYGDGYYGYGPTSSHTYLSPGTYTIKHHIYDSLQSACWDSTTQNITVTFQVTCQASFVFQRDSFNTGQYSFTSTASTNSGTITSYNWSINGNTVSNSPNFTHYFSQGNYSVCLSITTSTGCSSTVCQTISGAMPPCNAYGYTAIGSWPECRIMRFWAAPQPAPNRIYLWKFGDGTTSHEQDPVHYYPGPGTYNLSMTAVDTLLHCAGVTTGSVYIPVCPCDTAQIDINAVRAPSNPWQYVFSATGIPVDSLFNHTWTINKVPDSTSFHYTSNLASPTVVFTDTGYYNVCVDVTNNIGCPVRRCELIYIGGIDSVARNGSILAYPNPATDRTSFRLHLGRAENIKVVLYNANGTAAYSMENKGVPGLNILSVPLLRLNRGIYFIEIIAGNERKRSVVQKL